MQVYAIETESAKADYHGCGEAAGIVNKAGEVLRLVYVDDYADEGAAVDAVDDLMRANPGTSARYGMASCYELCV